MKLINFSYGFRESVIHVKRVEWIPKLLTLTSFACTCIFTKSSRLCAFSATLFPEMPSDVQLVCEALSFKIIVGKAPTPLDWQ